MGQQQVIPQQGWWMVASTSNTSGVQHVSNGLISKNQVQLSTMDRNHQCMMSGTSRTLAEEITQLGHVTSPRKKEFRSSPQGGHAQLSEYGTNMFANASIWGGVAQTSMDGNAVFELDPRQMLSPVP